MTTTHLGRLSDRVAIITGAGHGIGKVYARRFVAEGASVVLADIDGSSVEEGAEELRKKGFQAIGVQVDVRDQGSMNAMADAATSAFGKITVLINNAALFATVPMSRSPFNEIEVEEWDRMMAINLRGPWLAARAVFPAMTKQGYGKVVNISSGTALKGSASRIHYVTSKAGILGFTKTLAREMAPSGITVNCVAPGSTLSEEHPDADTLAMRDAAKSDRAIARVQHPSDLEGAVVFFASADSDFITGQTLVIDGGSFMH
ncbi:glucose 1-dehydrogenase [Glaciihabitans sp. UYNi722]|uniref:SDR family NAD(P)-dependent oxidoreductase n=1 Tax=Glaciihabitans sp. UYNi722 TaxID=3156344 RepID=UPI00339320EB